MARAKAAATSAKAASITHTAPLEESLEPIILDDAVELEYPEKIEPPKTPKETVRGTLLEYHVITEDSDAARELFAQGSFGVMVEKGQVQLSLLEALYLAEKKKLEVTDSRLKAVTVRQLQMRAKKLEPNFWVRYCVFRDIRNRGYIIKTALKFGADFRVYDRGIKPGEDHARWIVYPVHEAEELTWYEFAAKNRVAHSTKKRLMIGVVDDEGDVSYWEIRWLRP